MEDWRIQNQEDYLMEKTLYFKKYKRYRDDWDHDHCEFCGVKISEEPQDENYGYAMEDEYYWICKTFFHDFKDLFHWTLSNTDMKKE